MTSFLRSFHFSFINFFVIFGPIWYFVPATVFFLLVIQNYEFVAVSVSLFLWFMSAKVRTIPLTVVRRNKDCVRVISCLPYWTFEGNVPPLGQLFEAHSVTTFQYTRSEFGRGGSYRLPEDVHLGRLEIASASLSGGHRHGMVQTLSYTKIKGNEYRWQILRFRLKPHEKIHGQKKYVTNLL